MTDWKVTTRRREPRRLAVFHGSAERGRRLGRNFEFRLPLTWLLADPVPVNKDASQDSDPVATRLRLRFSLWQNRFAGGRIAGGRMDRVAPGE